MTQLVENLPAVQDTHVAWIKKTAPPPGEGNGHPLQYSCLENSMDRGVGRAI